MHKKQNTFWTDIWGQEVEHNKDAIWLGEIQKDVNGKTKHAQVQISQEKLKKILRKIPIRRSLYQMGCKGFG